MKKMMPKLLLAVVKFLCIIGLLYLSVALVLCIPKVLGTLEKNRLALIAGGAFVVGLPLFCFLRLNSLYVFGHELTHWVMAKIFLRKTGRFQSGKNAGAVEVENPNVWIILAPDHAHRQRVHPSLRCQGLRRPPWPQLCLPRDPDLLRPALRTGRP